MDIVANDYPKVKPQFAIGTKALWRNKDYDLPIVITGMMGEFNGIHYYSIQGSGTGVPENEILADKPSKPASAKLASVQNSQVQFFAKLGCSFVLLACKDKNPIEDEWQNKPRNAFAADKHLKRGGNVGIHGGKHSSNLVWLDVDVNARRFLDTFPNFRGGLAVIHGNAPDKAKFAIRITDRLPRSQKWKKDPTQKKPDFELLSTGNQAAVIGMHPSGVPYEHNDKDPLEMTFAQLSYIWRRWTGTALNDPTAPKTQAQPKAAQPAESNNDLAAKVKEHWDCLKVFAHFDRVGDKVTESNGDIRILGNGGLLIKPGRDTWYNHTDEVGGDCITAWHWCKTGEVMPTPVFVKTCYEMLEAAGAIMPKTESNLVITYDGEPVELPFSHALGALRQKYTQHTCYPQSRSNRYDRAVMLAFLDRVEAAGDIAIKFDVRTAGELSGMGSVTACKALRRLIEYGYLERCDKPSWFAGGAYDAVDQHIANQFDAYAYRLTPKALEVCEVDTAVGTSAGAYGCIDFAHIDEALDMSTLRRYLDHDAFQHGAKSIEDDPESTLGKIALDIIAALTVSNDQTYTELVEHTGASRTSISKKCKLMQQFGLVEVYQEGRMMVVYLVEAWQERLERVWLRLTTFARTIKRKISHLRARLDRARNSKWKVIGGALRLAIYKLIENWNRRLITLNRQLSELRALREATMQARML